MRLLNNHSGILHHMLKSAVEAGDKTLCFIADCVGFVVAEIRMKVIPGIEGSPRTLSALISATLKKKPSGTEKTAKAKFRKMTAQAAEPVITVTLPMSSTPNKIYTYEWAVEQMEKLEEAGIADPVSYFNNEMADWWLAPDGMMEKEADFVGIARAIEERWHQ